MQPIIDNQIHAIKGRFNHLYLINGEHMTLIDPEMPSSVQDVFRYVRNTLHRSPTDIRVVCATHCHPDHIGGLGYIYEKLAPTVALPNASRSYVRGKKRYRIPILQLLHLAKLMVRYRLRPTLGDLFTADIVGIWPIPNRFHAVVSQRLHNGSQLPQALGWTTLETPGHSPDSVSFYNEESETLLCGDLIINLDGKLYLNPVIMEDWNQAVQSLEMLQHLKVTQLCPGFGPPVTAEHVLEQVIQSGRAVS